MRRAIRPQKASISWKQTNYEIPEKRMTGAKNRPISQNDAPVERHFVALRHSAPTGLRHVEKNGLPSRWRAPRVRALPQGQVPEWSIGHAWKACVAATSPRVRIPPCPPLRKEESGESSPSLSRPSAPPVLRAGRDENPSEGQGSNARELVATLKFSEA